MLISLFVFDPQAAAQTLAGPGDRAALLGQLEDLSRTEVEAARGAGLTEAVARIAADEKAPLAERLLAARALGRLGGAPAVAALGPLVVKPEDPEAVALAREATLSLVRLEAVEALGPALSAADPEVRASAASLGAGPGQLCRLLEDAWPRVRAAAAQGLARHPQQAACLGRALADGDGRVQVAAARAAGGLKLEALRAPLRTLAGGGTPDARAEALVALAQLGELHLAEQALAAHLNDKGSEALAEAAVRALALRGNPSDRERLRAALAASPAVRVSAARALAALGDQEAIPALRARLADTPGAQRAVLQQALEALGEKSDQADPADTDPE